jgi:hypothetical protein
LAFAQTNKGYIRPAKPIEAAIPAERITPCSLQSGWLGVGNGKPGILFGTDILFAVSRKHDLVQARLGRRQAVGFSHSSSWLRYPAAFCCVFERVPTTLDGCFLDGAGSPDPYSGDI